MTRTITKARRSAIINQLSDLSKDGWAKARREDYAALEAELAEAESDAARELREADARRAAKFKIANVRVDNVSWPDGRDYSIGWDIGSDRLHVWVRRGEIEEVIYKNPSIKIERGAPGHFETRRLDRTSKASGAMFAEVLRIVERDNLVAKARIAERARIARQARQAELELAIANIEAEALSMFRDGAFSLDPAGFERLYVERRNARAALEALV